LIVALGTKKSKKGEIDISWGKVKKCSGRRGVEKGRRIKRIFFLPCSRRDQQHMKRSGGIVLLTLGQRRKAKSKTKN